MREMIAIGCLFIGGWLMSSSVRALVRGMLSRSWPATPGVVRSSRVLKKLNSEGDEVSRQEVEYSYSVNGAAYRSTCVRFGAPAALGWSGRAPAFRPGDEVQVFHSPSRPSISALQRGFSPFAILTFAVGGAILWMGLGLLLFSI